MITREFFLENRRGDLPKVPACQRCNGEKSQLEHYLTAVIPFGGRHPDATAALKEMVPKRLRKNRRLHEGLVLGLRQGAVVHPDAQPSQPIALTVPIDSDRLRRFFVLIAKGLVWYHWQTILGPGCSARAEAISETWARRYGQLFTMKARNRVAVNLGESTFCYEGLQAEEPPEFTIWRFAIYGGVCLAGDPQAPTATSTQVLAITGPEVELQKLEPALFGYRIFADDMPVRPAFAVPT